MAQQLKIKLDKDIKYDSLHTYNLKVPIKSKSTFLLMESILKHKCSILPIKNNYRKISEGLCYLLFLNVNSNFKM